MATLTLDEHAAFGGCAPLEQAPANLVGLTPGGRLDLRELVVKDLGTEAQIESAVIPMKLATEKSDDHAVAIYVTIVLLWSASLLLAIYFLRP
jgi:hypothetical protein